VNAAALVALQRGQIVNPECVCRRCGEVKEKDAETCLECNKELRGGVKR
jgi:hypothetical protein